MSELFYENGCPKKCEKCGSKKFDSIDCCYLDNYILCEYNCICADCKEPANYWAYGYWERAE